MRHEDLVILDGSDPAEARSIQRAARRGQYAKVAEGIYAKVNERPIEEIVLSQWAPILAKVAPGAVAGGRTGFRMAPFRERGKDGRPTLPGWIFATHPTGTASKRISLPGLEIRSLPGPGALEGDLPFLGIAMPSEARRLLENLKPSRAREGPSRTAGREQVEVEIDRILRADGENHLRHLLDHAARIAPALDAGHELAVLDDIVGTLLGTKDARLVARKVLVGRRRLDPYDQDCLDRLAMLADGLNRIPFERVSDPHTETDVRACVSFIEAYFTNYIEGTRFLVDKARRIVFENEYPDGRVADGRDVTETYAQVSVLVHGMAAPSDFGEFRAELRERNRRLLSGRPEKLGGEFKVEPNAAGNTVFVMPDLVEGTLKEGFSILGGMTNPFAKGLFVHALVALVHPFNDGNGRVSRIMMTKELVAAGCSRIVVPTIFRSDYIGGMRALSDGRGARPGPYVRSMMTLQGITSRIATPDVRRNIDVWASTHAFLEDELNARLTQPDPDLPIEWRRGIPAPESYWREVDLRARIAEMDDDFGRRFGS